MTYQQELTKIIEDSSVNVKRLNFTLSQGSNQRGYIVNLKAQISFYEETIAQAKVQLAEAPKGSDVTVDLYMQLKTVKLVNYKVSTNVGYRLLNGFALLDTGVDELVRMGNNKPYMPAGGKNATDSIVKSGLIGLPELYVSNNEQRASIT